MAKLHELLDHVLADKKITTNEVQVIRSHVEEDGQLDLADVRFLIEALTGAKEVCPEFDELFFPVLKDVFLADGVIDQGELFHLLKMLYSDGEIRPSELKFLQELKQEAQQVPAEFEELVSIARNAHPTEWSVDGDSSSDTSQANGGW